MRVQGLVILSVLISACNSNHAPAKESTDKAMPEHSMHSVVAARGYSDSVNSGIIVNDTMKGSPARVSMNTVHGTHVHIEYNSPGVKGRVIWGGLVAYDKVWATGAHHATRISFSKNIKINETEIPEGTYALFTIPGKDEWTLIINRNYKQHLTDDYNEREDLVRVKVKPVEHPMTPRLTYAVEELSGNNGAIHIQWEKLRVTVPFETL